MMILGQKKPGYKDCKPADGMMAADRAAEVRHVCMAALETGYVFFNKRAIGVRLTARRTAREGGTIDLPPKQPNFTPAIAATVTSTVWPLKEWVDRTPK